MLKVALCAFWNPSRMGIDRQPLILFFHHTEAMPDPPRLAFARVLCIVEVMKRLPVLVVLFFALQALGAEPSAPAVAKPRHVVVMVWDGMRPDFVTETNTPALFQLARQGVTFKNHHPVYISSTEVNGAAMATGDYPGTNWIVANREYRPEINPMKAVATESMGTARKAGKNYLGAKTIAQILQEQGMPTTVAGTKGVVILQDPGLERVSEAALKSVNLIAGQSLPAAAQEMIVKEQGTFPPEVMFPNEKQDNWTAKSLTDTLWKDGLPAFSLLWMSDPDYSQHQSAPGSPTALAAIKDNDSRLASVLAVIETKGAKSDTDVFVVSDHGFSTIEKSIDLQAILVAAGFKVSSGEFSEPPKPGDILMVGLGGSVLFYVIGHDEIVTRKLVDFFQESDFAGVIFSRVAVEGAFGLDQARIASPGAPDVVLAFHSNAGKNQYGAPGLIDAVGKGAEGKGMHASLGRYDMHNTLIAAGPDFRKGMADDLPTGNVDLAPTILKILGVPAPTPMDGRVLDEALVDGGDKPAVKNFTVEAKRSLEKTRWRQYLDVSQVGTTVYFNEGNGGAVPSE
jgi:arylsulfatase A-like enzyme